MKEYKSSNCTIRIHSGKTFNADRIVIPESAAVRYAQAILKERKDFFEERKCSG